MEQISLADIYRGESESMDSKGKRGLQSLHRRVCATFVRIENQSRDPSAVCERALLLCRQGSHRDQRTGGVVGHISMFNQRFCQMHPEAIAKQTDDPDTDKEIGDSVALRHVLSDFFTALEEYHFSIFIADSACDSYGKYSMLKNEFGFSRVVILINARNSKFSNARFDAASLRSVLLPLKKFRYICVC